MLKDKKQQSTRGSGQQKHAKNLIEMKTFQNVKCIAYPHDRIYTAKANIRSRELYSATQEEIKTALEKQVVTDYKRITLRKGGEEKQTHTCIETFNTPVTSKKG